VENKKTFFDALLKTKYGKNIKKKLTKKAKKLPLSLKALALGSGLVSGEIPIKLEKKVGKTGKFSLEANPKKKSIGLWYKKSF
jgi:hypothetical protein